MHTPRNTGKSIHVKWVIGHHKLIYVNLFANLFMEQSSKTKKHLTPWKFPVLSPS